VERFSSYGESSLDCCVASYSRKSRHAHPLEKPCKLENSSRGCLNHSRGNGLNAQSI
jgi:hypothetical protein